MKSKVGYDVEKKWLYQQVAVALAVRYHENPEELVKAAKKITEAIMAAADEAAKEAK